ncbi:MAG TPA: HAD family phosphatase [Solirubrobacteraceae bacterium]|nr:HAD family phosphatase [Solirubrobacteraceae bacterium]
MATDLALVIFDCDGVLVDSEPISNAVLAASLTTAGLPTSAAEAVREYKGMLLADVRARAEQLLGRPLPDGLLDDFERHREQAFRESLQAMPGAREVVQAVQAAGVAVCVASQGKLQKTEQTLTLAGLRDLFPDDALFSAYQVPRGKPHPDLFWHAAAVMGAAPEHCAVVEDTVIGVTAAVAAGMRVIGYAAAEDPAALRAAGALPVRSLAEVPAVLGLG